MWHGFVHIAYCEKMLENGVSLESYFRNPYNRGVDSEICTSSNVGCCEIWHISLLMLL